MNTPTLSVILKVKGNNRQKATVVSATETHAVVKSADDDQTTVNADQVNSANCSLAVLPYFPYLNPQYRHHPPHPRHPPPATHHPPLTTDHPPFPHHPPPNHSFLKLLHADALECTLYQIGQAKKLSSSQFPGAKVTKVKAERRGGLAPERADFVANFLRDKTVVEEVCECKFLTSPRRHP